MSDITSPSYWRSILTSFNFDELPQEVALKNGSQFIYERDEFVVEFSTGGLWVKDIDIHGQSSISGIEDLKNRYYRKTKCILK